MYSRNLGGIKSDGQLLEMQEELRRSYAEEHEPEPEPQAALPSPPPPKAEGGKRLLDLGFLKNIQIDDLILIGIGILLLLDSDGGNDMLVLLIALMLFF